MRVADDDPTALDVEGPVEALTPDRLDDMRRCKAAVLTILRRRKVRRQVAGLLRQARRTQRDVAVAMRDAWDERLAICTIDGGLAEVHAEQVALAGIQELLHF